MLIIISDQMSNNDMFAVTTCFSDMSSPKCIRKTTELGISSIILIITLLVLGRHMKLHRDPDRWTFCLLCLIIVCLVVNMAFCVWDKLYQLYSLETYFDSLYFLCLVSSLCRKYLNKHKAFNDVDIALSEQLSQELQLTNSKKMRCYGKIYYVVVFLVFGLYTGIFVSSVTQITIAIKNGETTRSCQEIWYLYVNGLCIALSIIAATILYINQKQQLKKLNQFQNNHLNLQLNNNSNSQTIKLKQPFRMLWLWIGINIAAKILDLIQSGMFLNANPPECKIIENTLGNNILILVFVVVTLYIEFVSTLAYVYDVDTNSMAEIYDFSRRISSDSFRAVGTIQMWGARGWDEQSRASRVSQLPK